jgi:hypothetical protein
MDKSLIGEFIQLFLTIQERKSFDNDMTQALSALIDDFDNIHKFYPQLHRFILQSLEESSIVGIDLLSSLLVHSSFLNYDLDSVDFHD